MKRQPSRLNQIKSGYEIHHQKYSQVSCSYRKALLLIIRAVAKFIWRGEAGAI